jgi:hypothetical protein
MKVALSSLELLARVGELYTITELRRMIDNSFLFRNFRLFNLTCYSIVTEVVPVTILYDPPDVCYYHDVSVCKSRKNEKMMGLLPALVHARKIDLSGYLYLKNRDMNYLKNCIYLNLSRTTINLQLTLLSR